MTQPDGGYYHAAREQAARAAKLIDRQEYTAATARAALAQAYAALAQVEHDRKGGRS